MVLSRSVCVLTTMPGATGVVQEDGVPARPSISTRQRRQEPKASTMSVAQSFGIWMPASIEARIIEVPSGTVTSKPSTVSVTIFSDVEAGVPKSISWMRPILWLLFGRDGNRRRLEVIGEVVDRAHHRIRREAAQR